MQSNVNKSESVSTEIVKMIAELDMRNHSSALWKEVRWAGIEKYEYKALARTYHFYARKIQWRFWKHKREIGGYLGRFWHSLDFC